MKNWTFSCMYLRVRKDMFACTSCTLLFRNARIAYMYVCTQSVYIKVVFMNGMHSAYISHRTCFFLLYLFLQMLHNFFCRYLKVDSHLQQCFISFNDSPSKIMKNAFYFILKALFVLKIFKFLSWLFGHVEKKSLFRKIRLISKFMTVQPG